MRGDRGAGRVRYRPYPCPTTSSERRHQPCRRPDWLPRRTTDRTARFILKSHLAFCNGTDGARMAVAGRRTFGELPSSPAEHQRFVPRTRQTPGRRRPHMRVLLPIGHRLLLDRRLLHAWWADDAATASRQSSITAGGRTPSAVRTPGCVVRALRDGNRCTTPSPRERSKFTRKRYMNKTSACRCAHMPVRLFAGVTSSNRNRRCQ